ncbi:MAG: hypothetical protein AAGF94_09555 [Pseudomonadota bacterium]
MTPMVATADGPPPTDVSDFGAAPSAVGGTRELFANKSSGAPSAAVSGFTNVGPNLLRVSVGEAQGFVQIIWDGSADDTVNPAGLGGLDFMIYDALEIFVTKSDIGGPIRFGFANALGHLAETTIDVPGGIPNNSLVLLSVALKPVNFTLFGSSSFEDILGNVGAVRMTIDAESVAQETWESRYAVVALTGTQAPDTAVIPLPMPALLLLTGLCGLVLAARRCV